MRLLLILLGWLLMFVSAGAAPVEQCNQGKPVRFASQTWESAEFTMNVLQQILDKAYGCQTEAVPGTAAATETALTQNDLQVVAELWSGRTKIIVDAIKAGTVQVVGDTLAGGATQGWYVPDYVINGDAKRGIKAVAPDLRSWKDLPKYKELFADPETPGKGRFLNCPNGWVCEKTNTRLLKVLNLDQDYTNFRAGTGAALDAAISSAYDQGKPILFYYWQPTGLMAKYKFKKIGLPPFNQACWDVVVSGKGELCPTDFLVAHLGIAVSTPFAKRNPEIMGLFQRVQFKPALLNQIIYTMTSQHIRGDVAAERFLRERPDIWKAWMPADRAARMAQALGLQSAVAHSSHSIFPSVSMTNYVNKQLVSAVQRYGRSLHAFSNFILTTVLLPMEQFFEGVPPALFLLFVGALAWNATRKASLALCYMVGLYAIGAVGLWDKLMQTFALVLVSTVFAIIIGIPIGILMARHRLLRRVLTPVLDVMQTLPSFVYLIPVLMFFGLGKVPALFATIIYAVPPLIRLTTLGLRQVDFDIMEAAQSFGVTRWQMLTRVTLPLARPSIMAGINQTTMMALAMVVVASMIGARGLGEDVLAGIQTLNVGLGLQAGLAIVILAIVIDRITQAYGKSRRSAQAQNKMDVRDE
ncbi:MAG: ABC transporter permease subunit [Candidimonas sp.]|nr:MAG: ABC transporter permease subunit [Candidimonas sp.]TAM22551.1 MAG: ABC transporter permease subunit [Candidimonas sp.]TAM75963.1 MAG: ABC transporter permease subunit [Candidimonas sp.]